MAAPASVRPEEAPLAEGIVRYVELFRQQPPAETLAGMRLSGDLGASRFAETGERLETFDTAIALPGREVAARVHVHAGEGPYPAICYFHGGGFSHGSTASFDVASHALARASGAQVVSIQYRRLPDSDFAAAQEDCDAAFAWLARNAALLGADPARLVLAGDSVGALLALNCALARRGQGIQPSALLLFYGAFALRREDPAYHDAGDPLLGPERIAAFVDLYARCGGPADPLDRPDFGGLPPVHLVAARHDPLAVDSARLADALRAAGVKVDLRVAPGMIHGFLRAVALSPPAREELRRAAQALRQDMQGAG